jgi:porphobilinogen synthase
VNQAARRAVAQGIPAVLLFGLSQKKTPEGRGAYQANSVVAQSIRALRKEFADLLILTDVCLCSYTTDGHCGVLRNRDVDNDRTVDLLGRMSLIHAEAGADLVAPSAMMDHQVAGIRAALDTAGFSDVGILSYAAKFASALYGPFRDAADSTPAFGDRRGYQLDDRNARDAQREIELDVAEGADIVMVKPAMPCLDVIARAKASVNVPVAAYQVSGEYAMIKAAAEHGWIDERAAILESLRAIHRAGADLIVTYAALDFSRWSGGRVMRTG